jgi:hypothetical protein
VSQQRSLQCDDDIFHLLTSDRVTFLVSPAKLLIVLFKPMLNLSTAKYERPF